VNQQQKRIERERSKREQSPSTRPYTSEEAGSWRIEIRTGIVVAVAVEVEVVGEFAGKAGAGAGNDSAAQSEAVDDNHEVGNGVGL